MAALTEGDILRAHGIRGNTRTNLSDLEAERRRPGPRPVRDYHHCLDCMLAMIPDTSPRQYCHFCARTRTVFGLR